MDMVSIIDNSNIKLADFIKNRIKTSKEAKFALGYFFLSGWDIVKNDLPNDLKDRRQQLENNLAKEEEEELKQLEKENLKTIKDVYEAIKNDTEINNLIKKLKSHEWIKIIGGG